MKQFIDANDTNAVYKFLVDNFLFTKEELKLVTSINGYNVESLNSCMYSRFAMHDLEQLIDEDEMLRKAYTTQEEDEDED